MADTKISALTAATAYADANEFVINEAGTSKKLSGTLLRAGVGPVLVTGASGAANAQAAPSETWQTLSADNTGVTGTTLAAQITTTSLPVGKYFYEYYIVWRSGTSTTGLNLTVDYTGTVTRTRSVRHGQTGLATAADGIADGDIATVTGGVVQAWASRADNGAMGPSEGVDTINVDQFEHVRGIIVVSTSANLVLMAAAQIAATTITVMADSTLLLKRLA